MDENEEVEQIKDMDMSWMEEQEKLENIQEIPYRESMNSIQCYILFVNKSNDVFNIVSKKIKVVDNVVTREAISTVIQKESREPFVVVDDIILYNITIEPQQIQSFSNSILENNQISQCSFFKNGLVNKDILIQPSIFVFHQINSLIVVLREKIEPKSIMKKQSSGVKSTKKFVLFSIQPFRKKQNYDPHVKYHPPHPPPPHR